MSNCKSHFNIPDMGGMSVWSFWAIQDIIMSYRDGVYPLKGGAIWQVAAYQAIQGCDLVLHVHVHGWFPCVTAKPTTFSWNSNRIIRYVHGAVS